MNDPTLEQRLLQHAAQGRLPFHMPGHKRRVLHTPSLPWALDITEIDGFDDLHDPDGLLAEGMARAAALWGSRESRYLVNGSTGGLLSALHALLSPGSTVLVARNCHKSVYHALELLHAHPVYLLPPVEPSFGVAGSLPSEAVALALRQHPDARALVLPSPTYDGVLSDLTALCSLCHAQGVPVLVDEAHGAHLGFGPFPAGALAAGADVVIHSLHKTLPSLTQTGLLHLQGTLVDAQALHRSLGIFQTSSPSYPLMASLDGCIRFLEQDGTTRATEWYDALQAFDRAIAPLQRLQVLGRGDLPPEWHGFDPSKVVISTQNTTLTGPQLAHLLRERFHIEPEMTAPHYVTAMTGMGDTAASLSALAAALLTIDSECGTAAPAPLPNPVAPWVSCPATQALNCPHEDVPLAESLGRVGAEYLWAYPPGIPLLVPGEHLTAETIDLCLEYEARGVPLKHTGGSAQNRVQVCQDPLT